MDKGLLIQMSNIEDSGSRQHINAPILPCKVIRSTKGGCKISAISFGSRYHALSNRPNRHVKQRVQHYCLPSSSNPSEQLELNSLKPNLLRCQAIRLAVSYHQLNISRTNEGMLRNVNLYWRLALMLCCKDVSHCDLHACWLHVGMQAIIF